MKTRLALCLSSFFLASQMLDVVAVDSVQASRTLFGPSNSSEAQKAIADVESNFIPEVNGSETSTFDFLNVTEERNDTATSLGAFLELSPAEDNLCTPEYTIMGMLERKAGSLKPLNLSLTTDALKKTGISSILESQEDEFKAYILFAPTDNAWMKLKERLSANPSQADDDPLSALLTYLIFGTLNQTQFDALQQLIMTGERENSVLPASVLSVPLDMLDGNMTVLSVNTEDKLRAINNVPIIANESACNGLVVAIDDVLIPGIATEKMLNQTNQPARKDARGEEEAGPQASEECSDIAPPAPLGTQWTCTEQKKWNKCGESWMWNNQYCKATCNFCGKSENPNPQAAAVTQAPVPVETYITDPCACTPDGVSGKSNTGVAGCNTMTVPQLMGMAYASSISPAAVEIGRQVGSRFDGSVPEGASWNYCYVVNPSKCRKYTEKSPFFKGARWRFC